MAYRKRSNANARYSCAKRNRAGYRAGLFLGGVAFGLVRGIFFRNKY